MRAIAKLCHEGHRNLVQVLAFGHFPDDTYAFIDMELCNLNLEDYNKSNWTRIQYAHRIPIGSLELEIWNIMMQIANGLMFIHEQHEVHRDLKPRNGLRFCIMLMVVLYSERDRAWKLTDFGLTCEGASHGSHTTEFGRGTPGYRSPELLMEDRHVFSAKVDIWAMGIILHELVTGKQPFPTDAAVLEHYRSKQHIKLRLNEGFDERSKTAIYTSIMEMLHQKASARPTAETLVQKFTEYYATAVTLENVASISRAEFIASPSIPNGDNVFKIPLKRQCDSSLDEDGGINKRSKPSFGPDHPETLRLHHQLAAIYQKLGRYQEAAELWEDTVKRRTHILGPDHSDTRSSQDRLTFAYGSLRQHQEATEMCKEIVLRNRNTLGLDHPDTLTSQHELAVIYGNLGEYQDAAELYEDTVKHRIVQLGADHPDTLSSQYNLAMIYRNLGRDEEAAELENSLKLSRSRFKSGLTLEFERSFLESS